MADISKEMAVGGKLKLKKGSGVTKKKANQGMKTSVDAVSSKAATAVKRKSEDDGGTVEERTTTVVVETEWKAPTKTRAELAFERRQLELQADRVFKKAQMSHREKVEKFNAQMNDLTEFNDIPKVSWTK